MSVGPWQIREQAQDVTGPDCPRQDGTETTGKGEADCPENCAGQSLPRLPSDRGRVEAGHRQPVVWAPLQALLWDIH